MSSKKNHNDDDTLSNYSNYEFSSVPYEYYRDPKPFKNFPPGNLNPGGFYPPFVPPIYPNGGGFNPNNGGYNPNGGSFNPGATPQGPPPNYVPSKKDKGVQSLNGEKGNVNTKAVSPTSISFCLYKYTYIWEVNGRSYWTFLLYVDRTTVSGFRWLGRNWVYFGLDLRRIDSFVCYRSDDTCTDCNDFRNEENSYKVTCNEYTLNQNRNCYTEVLASVNIPEVKEDYIVKTIGYVDEDPVNTEIPCLKYRNNNYKIVLQVSYPDNFDESLKNAINEMAKKSSNIAYESLSLYRINNDYANPLELFNKLVTLIPKLLNEFNSSFSNKIDRLSDYKNDIKFCIKEEVTHENWIPQ